jgi:hypothetical protein
MDADTKESGNAERVRAYKRILEQVLATRPSGTRLKLANALGKNRSFVSQIANPAYSTPIPAQHLPTIFDVCHFTAEKRRVFLDAYTLAHPRRHYPNRDKSHQRSIAVTVPDLGDPGRNRAIDEMVADFARKLCHMAQVVQLQTKEESKP